MVPEEAAGEALEEASAVDQVTVVERLQRPSAPLPRQFATTTEFRRFPEVLIKNRFYRGIRWTPEVIHHRLPRREVYTARPVRRIVASITTTTTTIIKRDRRRQRLQ